MKNRKKGGLAIIFGLVLVLLSGCGAKDTGEEGAQGDGLRNQEEQSAGTAGENSPEREGGSDSTAESGGADDSADEKTTGSLADADKPGASGGNVITEAVLQQGRDAFNACAENRGLSGEETENLYRRLLESGVMELEGMLVTGMAAGDYDGNGHTDMVVCLYSLEENADYYGDGCLYLFMNEDEPYRIYEEACCYGLGSIRDDFGADIDGDGKTEILFLVGGIGNGGPGDSCIFAMKYEAPGIRRMELPNNLTNESDGVDCGIEVSVIGDPERKKYTAYCGELDQTFAFAAGRTVDDSRGGNCRGYYSLKLGEYQGDTVLLGYEYLYAGGIAEYVGDAVFVIDWDDSGSSYVRDWYIEGGKLSEGFSSDPVRSAYRSFLSGHLFFFDTEDIKTWGLNTWMNNYFPAFAFGGELEYVYEYVYMDLDGDGVEELLLQYINSPESYNGVFHYADGRLYCWQHDAVEMTCRDYPLKDGTMVRQYDTNGTNIYNLFRYQSDGDEVTVCSLFARTELWDESSTDPCPYYEVDGREVDKQEFERLLKELVTDQRLDPSDWTVLFY
ncbi:MAG: hypothetical protein NC517_09355 [Firmicutes bacterium]|nr:hypothetical protein [Bacillota bacterium]